MAPDVRSGSGTPMNEPARRDELAHAETRHGAGNAHADTLHAGGGDPPPRTSEPELAAGTLLDGAYRVIKRIGAGGMGAVYLVEHERLGRRFAAKVVTSTHAADPEVVARLRNEARVASSIQHENIVDVTHLGHTADGSLFVVMELLEGSDLRQRLAEQEDTTRPWLPDEESRRIAHDVLAGLESAHEAGVIHRDLKPDNIFLVKKAGKVRAKIVDFGISKMKHASDDLRLTRTGQIIGTPLYMAPEQTKGGDHVDRRTDVYAMGVILFEMVTGQLPFEASTVYEIIVKHATEDPRRPRALRPDLPQAVEDVLLRCMKKNPAERFQTAAELSAAFERAWSEPAAAPLQGATTGPVDVPASVSARTAASTVVSAVVSAEVRPPRAPGSRSLALIAVGVALAMGIAAVVVSGSGSTAPATSEPRSIEPGRPTPSPPPPARPATEATGTPPPAVVDPAPGEEPPPRRHRIESEPAAAEVWVGGERVGATPYELVLDHGEPVEIELRAEGRRAVTRTITNDDPDALHVELPRRGGGGRRDDLPALAPL
jgi:serine/threonine-protein kinase